MSKPFAVSLMGPTASGKTSLSIKLAEALNGEIISVDSVLIYKGMDIGSAKPSLEERCGIPHHLIDILDPAQSYSVADFRGDALKLCAEIQARGKVPILAGGTMLYFKSLTDGLSSLPDTIPEIRAQVTNLIKEKGLPYVREQLRLIDEKSYARINENDPQRIGRALEIYLMTNKSMTQLLAETPPYECPLDLMQFSILPDRARLELKPLIAQRFDLMLKQGLLEETQKLFARGDLTLKMPSIRAVGYRQMWMYLTGEVTLDKARELAIIATCQLAKRQMTWLRGWKTEVHELKAHDPENLSRVLETIKNHKKACN